MPALSQHRFCFVTFLVALLASVFLSSVRAQSVAHSRLFRFGSEAPSAISIGPRGTVWMRHGDTPRISSFDGFTTRELLAPEGGSFRPHESRAGQVWTCYNQGLLMYDRGNWTRYPIPEIAQEMQQNPLRQLRQISLAPLDVNRVLVLTSDLLLEFNAFERVIKPIKRAASVGLGPFNDMQETRDGSLLISAERGVARIAGPSRQVTSETPWRSFPIPRDAQYHNLQRPFENASGNIIAVAPAIGDNSRAIAVLADGEWEFRNVSSDRLKQAWFGWSDTIWAFSYNSLLRLIGPEGNALREASVGAQFDLAVDGDGVFWIASSEGLTRYAPQAWQTPSFASQVRNAVQSVAFDAPDDVWAATSEGLVHAATHGSQTFPWPENVESVSSMPRKLIALDDGRFAIASSAECLLFDSRNGEFHRLAHPEGGDLSFVGVVNESLAFRRSQQNKPITIVTFDGESFSHYLDGPALAQIGPEITFLHESRTGDIWVGGAGGLAIYRKAKQEFELHVPENGFTGRPLAHLELSETRSWISTAEQILELDGSAWRLVHTSPDRIFGMMKTLAGKVFVSAAGGVLRHEKGVFLRNDDEDGLPSAAVFSVMEDPAGGIWAATAAGIARLNLNADVEPPRAKPPVIQDSEMLTSERSVLVNFDATDRWSSTPSHLLLYSWRVDEAAWSPYSGSTVAIINDLRPGPHTLQVRAMDRYGNEDPEGAAVDFAIILPWHDDPRLVGVTIAGMVVILALAGFAVNRHWRLRRSYAEVGKIVAQRTQELQRANEELLHSQKMRALGALAAGIAHDFNNLLSIIKGSAQIIESNLDDREKVKTRIGRIKMMVDQGSGIVRSMLGLGRLSDRELVEVDIVALADETVRALSEKIPASISVIVDRDPTVPRLRCYRDLLQQMLVNLILNAVDAIHGTGRIRVRFAWNHRGADLILEPAPATTYLSIFIEDTGTGIAPEVLPRIFEPFFTTKALSSRRGTGLGLSMVYEMAKGTGCGLGVSSRVGIGTIFQIVVPNAAPKLEEHFEPNESAPVS